MDNMSIPIQHGSYIKKIPSPCLSGCENIARDEKVCTICTAKTAYADHVEGVEHSVYIFETGPEILEKSGSNPGKYAPRNKEPKKRANGKQIVKRLGYENESDMLDDLYYDQRMTYAEMASLIRYKTNGPCTTGYIKGIFRRTDKIPRGINDYRGKDGKITKNEKRETNGSA